MNKSKPAKSSRTIQAFGLSFSAAVVVLCLHYTDAVPVGAELLGGAWVAAVLGVLGIAMRFRTGVPLGRGPKQRGSARIEVLLLTLLLALLLGLTLWAMSCDTRFGRSLPRAGACAAACAVECSQSSDTTSCAVRCALACAAEWVGGLLTREQAKEQLASLPELPEAGDGLVVPVDADGTTLLLRGHLSGKALHVGGGAFVVRFVDGRGPGFLLPLCVEMRPYCASLAGAPGDLPAVSGPPPRSLAEFGELPSLTP